MILLSTPPTPIAEIHADRILAVSGSLDIPRISAFSPILADIGSPHVELRILPWSGHSGVILNPRYVRQILEWLESNGGKTNTLARYFCITLIIFSGITLGRSLMAGRDVKPLPVAIPATLVRYVTACGFALLILKVLVPLVWLRLFATDYLISFFLLAGTILWIQKPGSIRLNRHAILKAIMAAAFVIVVFCFVAGSHFLNMSLWNGRWWRFPLIMAASLPLFAFDELNLRAIQPRWKSAAVAVITRILFWAFLLTGVLLLNRQSTFLVLIAHLIALFWITLWFGADVVRRHTQDPLAAAIFAALIQGWAFAAWFVTL